jgi:phosphohistidine phosphatase
MRLVLVHHADAVGPEVDPQRPLSMAGRFDVERLASAAAARGVKPAVIWHSGKLRARQTAEAFWKACNPFAELKASRGLQPSDGPWLFRDLLVEEDRDLLAVGHMPSLPRILALLVAGSDDAHATFPLHGLVALRRDGVDGPWTEDWRLATDRASP